MRIFAIVNAVESFPDGQNGRFEPESERFLAKSCIRGRGALPASFFSARPLRPEYSATLILRHQKRRTGNLYDLSAFLLIRHTAPNACE